MAILGGQRGGGSFVFLLQLHFVLQLNCMAARTALNTKNIVPSLHGWDCPRRGVSCQLLCLELHLGGEWALPGVPLVPLTVASGIFFGQEQLWCLRVSGCGCVPVGDC